MRGRLLIKLEIPKTNLHTRRHSLAGCFYMDPKDLRALQKLFGHSSSKTTEIYAHLSEDYLHSLINSRPRFNWGTISGTALAWSEDEITEIIEKEMVGDTGFEPVTPTV
jgi:hypothetical protein